MELAWGKTSDGRCTATRLVVTANEFWLEIGNGRI